MSVVDFSKAAPRRGESYVFSFLYRVNEGCKMRDLVYGRNTYDYQEGTLVFLAPGQVVGVNSNGEIYQSKG